MDTRHPVWRKLPDHCHIRYHASSCFKSNTELIQLGTDKVNLSIELNKIWIIKLEWFSKFTRLLDSIESFSRLDEKDYLLDNAVRPVIVAEKKTITNWDDADEELNQFLNEEDSNEDEDTTEETQSESSNPTNSIKTEDHIERSKDANSDASSDDDWLNAEISTAVQNISGGPTLKRKYSPSL